MSIVEINAQAAKQIIESRHPIGKFIVSDGRGTYTAIDNTTGEAFTEDFDTRDEAENWLSYAGITTDTRPAAEPDPEIEEAVTDDTHQVIVDARGIGSVDITAAERLVLLNKSLRSRGIYFYLTEHDGSLNDQLRRLGGGSLIEEGAVRRTISLALRDAGVEKPYELEGDEDAGAEKPYKMEGDEDDSVRGSVNITGNGDVCGEAVRNAGQEMTRAVEADERLSEFEWAFGKDAEKRMEEFAGQMADEIARAAGEGGNVESVEAQMLDREGVRTPWGMLGRFDEDEFWDFVELRLEELKAKEEVSPEFVKRVEKHVEERRRFGQQKLRELSPRAAGLLARRREVIFNYMRRKHPEEYEKLLKIHEEQKREEL